MRENFHTQNVLISILEFKIDFVIEMNKKKIFCNASLLNAENVNSF